MWELHRIILPPLFVDDHLAVGVVVVHSTVRLENGSDTTVRRFSPKCT